MRPKSSDPAGGSEQSVAALDRNLLIERALSGAKDGCCNSNRFILTPIILVKYISCAFDLSLTLATLPVFPVAPNRSISPKAERQVNFQEAL